MPTSKLKQLRLDLSKPPQSKRARKANRTFYLTEPQAKTFIDYCKARNHHPSEVVDRLITMFLEEVRDELPAGSLPTSDKV